MEDMEGLSINDFYKGKKALVTGHTGFKGSWLTTWLLKMGANVVGLSNEIPTNPSLFELLSLEGQIKHYTEDIRNKDKISEIIKSEKPDILFHLAAQPIVSLSYKDPLDTITTNVTGTANILDSLRNTDFNCTVVVVTSDKCYDNKEWVWGYREIDHLGGKDIYSASKGCTEIIARSFFHSFFSEVDSNIRLVTVRAGNIIGGGDWADDRIVPDAIRAWEKNTKLKIRSPYSIRPWQHVLDSLSGYLLVAKKLSENADINGEAFNFGPKDEIDKPVKDLIFDLAKNWGFDKNEEAYEIVGNPVFKESNFLRLNTDKSFIQLKWRTTLLYNEAIRFTAQWYRNHFNNLIDPFQFTTEQINSYEKLAEKRNLNWIKA